MNITDLEPRGHDSWDRPIFYNATNKRWYCCTDLDATLDDVKAGKAVLYTKCGDAEGEPDCPVRLLNVFEPPAPPGYIIIQDGMFGEWTAIRDNDLGEIIGGGETRAEAVRCAELDDKRWMSQ